MTFYRNNITRNQSAAYDDDDNEYFQLPEITAVPTNKPRTRNLSQGVQHKIVANVSNTQYDVVLDVCENLLKWRLQFDNDSKNWDVMWTDSAVPSDTLMKMEQHQKINHFPGMSNLSRKNLLAKNLQKMQERFPEEYDFFPKTWILPYDYHKLRNYNTDMRRQSITKTFIVKPEASSQGRGIYLTKNLNGNPEIPDHEHCIVQKYMSSPLLFQGLKFDLRVYVLVAGCDPLRLYIYNQGIVRLATEPYEKPNADNLDNMYVHLTNYAINKDNPNFVFNTSEDNLSQGHKRSLAQFFQTLKKSGVNSSKIWSQIKDIIVKTMISGQTYLAHQYRMCQPHNLENDMCFQVLGFDIMIDSDSKAWLIEINYTPSFSCESPLDQLIKSNLIKDTLLLMNVTSSNRDNTVRRVKHEQQVRVLTGKVVRYDREKRAKVVAEMQRLRDQYENKNLGSYERIFQPFGEQLAKKYQLLLEYSQKCYVSPQKYGKKFPLNSNSSSPVKKKIEKKITMISTQSDGREQSQSQSQSQNHSSQNRSQNQSQSYEQPQYSRFNQKRVQIQLPKMTDRSSVSQDIRSIIQMSHKSQMQKLGKRPTFLMNPLMASRQDNIFLPNSYAYDPYQPRPEQDSTMFSKYARRR